MANGMRIEGRGGRVKAYSIIQGWVTMNQLQKPGLLNSG